ncbi:hypothetical protein [Methanosphaerula subterraneus]|uniref:hypothetical protein n=1 Tax=Methanosphaerula subterraneus TaxID=3350244 RepID=UPI003F8723BD
MREEKSDKSHLTAGPRMDEVVQQIKSGFLESLIGSDLTVRKIEIVMKSVLVKNFGGGFEWKPINFSIAGELKNEYIQEMSLSLKPPEVSEIRLMGEEPSIQEQLVKAVATIQRALNAAQAPPPLYVSRRPRSCSTGSRHRAKSDC